MTRQTQNEEAPRESESKRPDNSRDGHQGDWLARGNAVDSKTKPSPYLTREELLAEIPLSYVSIWTGMRDGKFPLPIELSSGKRGRVVWLRSEIEAWFAARPRRTPKPRRVA